jgi:uncharacterized repeat protein (TIGR01451 family)
MKRRTRGRSRRAVVAVAVVLTLVAAARVPALTAPALALDPSAGPAGAAVAVTGTGFERHCPVDVFVDSTTTDPLASAVPVSKAGTFSTTITIPADVQAGDHQIVARGVARRNNRNCLRPTPTEAAATYTVEEEVYDRTIYIGQRALEDPGVDEAFLDEIRSSTYPTHAIVQLHGLPERGQLAAIEDLGIRLLDYLNGVDAAGTAYIASISPDVDLQSATFGELVRAVQRLEPSDKKSLTLDTSVGTVDVLVVFFDDVANDEALATLREAGIEEPGQTGPHTYAASATGDQVEQLTAAETVQWIQERQEPLPLLDDARLTMGTEFLQGFSPSPVAGYAGLAGEGIQIGVMDSGVDDSHEDFSGRIIRKAPPAPFPNGDLDYHGTPVAGIAAGSGAASAKNGGQPFGWRGMAPKAEIAAYHWGGSDYNVMGDAIKNFGVEVTNHSYVFQVFGKYDAGIAALDDIIAGGLGEPPFNVRPDAYRRPAVSAAGNNADTKLRDCDGDGIKETPLPDYPPNDASGNCPTAYHPGYFSLTNPCKNCIVATAVAKENGEPDAPAEHLPRPNDLVHLPASGIGPTHDGRLKPDVSAVADFLRAPGPFNGYTWGGATSGASPVVSGIIALMYEQHMKKQATEHVFVPLFPSTVKALLIQSAIDLVGTDPTINFDTGQPVEYGVGPDFATGYGLVDARSAVRMVERREFEIAGVNEENPDQLHGIEVAPGQPELRVTLAWDDPPGTVDDSAVRRALVNDLDLTLKGPNGEIHRPLVLPTLRPHDCDPNNGARSVQVGTCPGKDDPKQNYFGPAKPGIDKINNVEQVVIKNPAPGTWQAQVSVLQAHRPGLKLPGTSMDVRLPEGGEQLYSLATGMTERPNLHTAMTDEPDTAQVAGAPVTYGITVANNGAATAPDVQVVGTLPSGAHFLGVSGASCNASSVDVVTCKLGDLASGEQRSFDLHVQASAGFGYKSYPPTMKNRARASSPVPDGDPSDNVAFEETEVTYAADTELVSLVITAPPTILIGEQATATIVMSVGNNGPASPVDAAVSLSASTSPGTGVAPTSSTLTADELHANTSRVMSHAIELSCLKKGVKTVTVSGTVAPPPPVSDPIAGNNLRSATAQLVCVPKGPTEL